MDYTPRGLEINKYIIEPSGCLFSSVFPLKMKESHHNTASAGAGYWTLSVASIYRHQYLKPSLYVSEDQHFNFAGTKQA